MSRSTIVIYPRRRWLPRSPVLVAAVLAGLAIGSFWPEADIVAPDPAPAAPAPARAALPPVPADALPTRAPEEPEEPEAREAREATEAPREAALSTMVAPGVHVTPIGVTPVGEPMPADPAPEDTEPEN